MESPSFIKSTGSFLSKQTSFTSEVLSRVMSKSDVVQQRSTSEDRLSSNSSTLTHIYDEDLPQLVSPTAGGQVMQASFGTEWVGYIFETLAAVFLIALFWYFFGLRVHDAVLALSAFLEMAAFVVLAKRLICSQSAYGVSLQSLYLFAIGVAARGVFVVYEAFAQSEYSCYGPEKGLWSTLYGAINVTTLGLVLACVKLVWSARSHDAQFDKLPAWPLFIAGMLLGLLTHTDCHHQTFINVIFMSGHWWIGFAFVPQLVYFDLRRFMERTTSYYMMLIISGHLVSFLVWLENIIDVVLHLEEDTRFLAFCCSLLIIQAMSVLASLKVITCFFMTWNEDKMILQEAV